MPTYEYECKTCGEHFEYFQGISEDPKTTCEKCHGPLVKLVSAGTGLIFKGSGFYITDYKRNGGNGSSDKKSSGEKTAAESKSTKSE